MGNEGQCVRDRNHSTGLSASVSLPMEIPWRAAAGPGVGPSVIRLLKHQF